jgi:transposase
MRKTKPKPVEKVRRTRERAENNTTTSAFRVTDELWAVLEPLLPKPINTHRFGGGRPRVPDRTCADGIFYVLRTGCQWNALGETGLCASSTAHDRFQEWVADGVFKRLWVVGLERFDEWVGMDWEWMSMDGAMTKAPLGGKKTGPNPTDRGKQGVKRSLLVDGHGIPLAVSIDGANRQDMKLVEPTFDALIPPCPPEQVLQGICLDKGYDYQAVRDYVVAHHILTPIRSPGEEKKAIADRPGDRARRWVVERLHSWMNRFRRLLIRWEKKADNYLAFVQFACALIAFRAAGLFG